MNIIQQHHMINSITSLCCCCTPPTRQCSTPPPPHPHPLLVNIPLPLHPLLFLSHLLQKLLLKLHQPRAQQHVVPPRACQPTIPLCTTWLHGAGVPLHHHSAVESRGEHGFYAGALAQTVPPRRRRERGRGGGGFVLWLLLLLVGGEDGQTVIMVKPPPVVCVCVMTVNALVNEIMTTCTSATNSQRTRDPYIYVSYMHSLTCTGRLLPNTHHKCRSNPQ